jgi:hypothetical protein
MNYKSSWYQKNKERERAKQRERDRLRYNDRKEYVANWTKQNPHTNKISTWKRQNIKLRPNEDWLSIWFAYELCENCEICNVKLTKDRYNTSTTKSLDHDHDTCFIRNIVCHKCNIARQ